ncbi:hypothetical protein [Geminisphaera colitermitum]|uniref:hypothetical protein n=1 Tax=Geminisphaera colitermitum TaxID=1148786 RepID=UPI00019654D3|nr:hypothetical protein [Geminisphaera colitermitum]
MESIRELLRARLKALGFDDVRFARATHLDDGGRLRAWIDAGHHADMHWMERTLDKRLAPALALPGVATIIMLGVNYGANQKAPPSLPPPPPPRLGPLLPVFGLS